MAKGARAIVDSSGIRRALARVRDVSEKKVEQIKKRSQATLARRLRAEAARQISEHQLNLSPGQISPYIRVKQGSTSSGDYVAVTASNERLPLRAFRPTFSKTSGVTVTTWRDAPALRLPHAFARGRDAWQRVPAGAGRPGGASGLVHRLPIVARKGPSLKHTLQPNVHSSNSHRRDQVVENLKGFARSILADEIERLLSQR